MESKLSLRNILEIIGYFGFVSLKFWLFEESGRLGVSEALVIFFVL